MFKKRVSVQYGAKRFASFMKEVSGYISRNYKAIPELHGRKLAADQVLRALISFAYDLQRRETLPPEGGKDILAPKASTFVEFDAGVLREYYLLRVSKYMSCINGAVVLGLLVDAALTKYFDGSSKTQFEISEWVYLHIQEEARFDSVECFIPAKRYEDDV